MLKIGVYGVAILGTMQRAVLSLARSHPVQSRVLVPIIIGSFLLLNFGNGIVHTTVVAKLV